MTSISITQDFPVPARPASKTAEFHAHVPKIFSIARLWAIARKEAIQLRRDARSLGLAFVLPVIMLVLWATRSPPTSSTSRRRSWTETTHRRVGRSRRRSASRTTSW